MNNSQHDPNSPVATENRLPVLSTRALDARRANALKSTGPRTTKGKSYSRLNALKHGFFSRDVVNPVLDGPHRLKEFNAMLKALLAEYDPQSVRERIMIDEVAACCWRIRRLMRFECREGWVDDETYRQNAMNQSPSEQIAATFGYDHQGDRERIFRKLRRAGLETLVVPCKVDLDRIVRYERLIKRNLFRALYTLERIRGARQSPETSDAAPLPEPIDFTHDLLDNENENEF
jgi:hypothetical protein